MQMKWIHSEYKRIQMTLPANGSPYSNAFNGTFNSHTIPTIFSLSEFRDSAMEINNSFFNELFQLIGYWGIQKA